MMRAGAALIPTGEFFFEARGFEQTDILTAHGGVAIVIWERTVRYITASSLTHHVLNVVDQNPLKLLVVAIDFSLRHLSLVLLFEGHINENEDEYYTKRRMHFVSCEQREVVITSLVVAAGMPQSVEMTQAANGILE